MTGWTDGIEAAVAAAERDGVRLHFRVRLAILAAIAVWLVVNYVPARAVPGLFAVAVFVALGVMQYVLGQRTPGHRLDCRVDVRSSAHPKARAITTVRMTSGVRARGSLIVALVA